MAVEANNLAWQLTLRDRTSEDDREMLNAAHAAAWHWYAIGTDLNKVRADALLAEVHALLGMGSTAWSYAERVHAYFATHPGEPWELAFMWLTRARAAHALGNHAVFQECRAEAWSRIESLGTDDREIVAMSFNTLPG
jgi:hypothetical protein